jgi:hypothetical protein
MTLTMHRVISCVSVALLLTVVPALAQTSLLEGRWRLNVAQSSYTPDPPPKSQILTWKRVPGGLQFTTDTISEQGEASHTETLEKDDGSPGQVRGSAGYRTRFLRRIDARTFEDGDVVNGQPTYQRRMVISRDGRSMTITVTGVNGFGQPINNTAIYEKQ